MLIVLRIYYKINKEKIIVEFTEQEQPYLFTVISISKFEIIKGK